MKTTFRTDFLKIALPIALQGVFQASFSVADQLMAGQLGSVAVAGIGLGGKFSSLYNVILSAIATAAGILMAQYAENPDPKYLGRTFYLNSALMLALAGCFTFLSIGFAPSIMGLYSTDSQTIQTASGYLKLVSLSFLPMAVASICATLLRCKGAASLPLYASVGSSILNSALNYVLIFGRLGLSAMGVRGAALATVISQFCGCGITVLSLILHSRKKSWQLPFSLSMEKRGWIQYLTVLLPILLCEFFWSLGENVYASVYGHIGTDACAAMTLTNPIQALMMGALTGVSQAAGILVGKALGRREFDNACRISKKLMQYGLTASLFLSVCLILIRGAYIQLFQIEPAVRTLTFHLLFFYALVAPIKVQNMILGGGILRSGGKTHYVMAVDLIGTWLFGVPLACLSAFVWKLPIPYVYFILSQEELVRLLISLYIFRKRLWLNRLDP